MTAEAQSVQRAGGGRLDGQMLWFNNDKGHGFIESATKERLRVEAADFSNGPPEGRCAGLAVTYQLDGDGESAKPFDVAFRDDAAPRRARIRRSAGR